VVTGGIEHNAGRVGDPATYYKPGSEPFKTGTINILLFLDCDLAPGILTRALVTCTEAKTAAIQELLQGSVYSRGLATGSGTDQTILVANGESSLYLDDAGKHAKLGELIGRVVKQAVKAALYKQTGLCPAGQHHALRRLERFGVQREKFMAGVFKTAAAAFVKTGVCKPFGAGGNRWDRGNPGFFIRPPFGPVRLGIIIRGRNGGRLPAAVNIIGGLSGGPGTAGC
jgi:hypothetical protein